MTHLRGDNGFAKCGASWTMINLNGDDWNTSTTDCPMCMPAPPIVSTVTAGPAVGATDPKSQRITFLERKREATKADLLLKFEDGDYHGVQDCASDLRDIESELKGLRA